MRTITTVAELKSVVTAHRRTGESIGLVPTMGALHDGHIRLVERCSKENDVCVVSIFVNPTQFNDKSDLDRYPRTLEADSLLLEPAGCHYLFAPSVEEIYPEEDKRVFDFSPLDSVMEGVHRPGHFNGVGLVVSKLFDMSNPHRAYFGKKDYQQLAIIMRMVELLDYNIEIVSCPIVRESDGLAMSSRNTRLTSEQREAAPQIYAALVASTKLKATKTVGEVVSFVKEEIAKNPLFRLEYFEIVDGETLEAIEQWSESVHPIGCIALFNGEIRLIDNIEYL